MEANGHRYVVPCSCGKRCAGSTMRGAHMAWGQHVLDCVARLAKSA